MIVSLVFVLAAHISQSRYSGVGTLLKRLLGVFLLLLQWEGEVKGVNNKYHGLHQMLRLHGGKAGAGWTGIEESYV